jgi:endonuclease-3
MTKTIDSLKKRATQIIKILKKTYPDVKCPLDHTNPLELLVATILAARCRDDLVNQVTKTLFKKYKTAADYAYARQSSLEKDISKIGFYKAKAKSIINACKTIVKKHGGKVPDNMEDLTSLSGVGRKTANVVLGAGYAKAEGIVIDTHAMRLSQRLGLTKQKNPDKIEIDLMKIIPKSEWIVFPFLLIYHGRAKCMAINPACPDCELAHLCPSRKTAGKPKRPAKFKQLSLFHVKH